MNDRETPSGFRKVWVSGRCVREDFLLRWSIVACVCKSNEKHKRSAAYFDRFKPRYFMYVGPGSEETWCFENYVDDQKGKWNELTK